MLGPDEMQEYEDARAEGESMQMPTSFALSWFSLWLALLAALAEKR